MTEAPPTESQTPERHASWPELFFDLIAVAGVSVVAHQLEEAQGWASIGVLAIVFTAFWILWASVTTYGNLLAERANTVVLFAAMAVLGVMAAAVPEVLGEHAQVFAIAYVLGRILIAQPWSRTSVVVDMPIVQASIGVLPWIVSIWVEGDARYIWWAVGIGLDLLRMLTNSTERALDVAQRRLDVVRDRRRQRTSERAARRGPSRGRPSPELPQSITALRSDGIHLSERMGLFVLIILGEAIIQLTVAAAQSEHWDAALLWAALGAFAFIALLFLFGIARGTAGLALVATEQLPVRFLWLGHLLISMALVTIGAGLGRLLEEPRDPTTLHTAVMLAIGTAVFGLVSAGAHLIARGTRANAMAIAVALPFVAASGAVLLAQPMIAAAWLGWLLAAGALSVAAVGNRLAGHRRPPRRMRKA